MNKQYSSIILSLFAIAFVHGETALINNISDIMKEMPHNLQQCRPIAEQKDESPESSLYDKAYKFGSSFGKLGFSLCKTTLPLTFNVGASTLMLGASTCNAMSQLCSSIFIDEKINHASPIPSVYDSIFEFKSSVYNLSSSLWNTTLPLTSEAGYSLFDFGSALSYSTFKFSKSVFSFTKDKSAEFKAQLEAMPDHLQKELIAYVNKACAKYKRNYHNKFKSSLEFNFSNM